MNFVRSFTEQCPGSVLAECGKTRVLCTVTVQDQVPPWMVGKTGGWLTAEYAMLPGASSQRKPRDGRTGRPIDGRSQEIQRMVGRAMRCAMDLTMLPEMTLWVDCDVLSADGGTRVASITGAWVALALAIGKLVADGKLADARALKPPVAAVSVGIVGGELVLDLAYAEDSAAEVDMNVVGSEDGSLIEVQGTAEHGTFDRRQLDAMLDLAGAGIRELAAAQRRVIA